MADKKPRYQGEVIVYENCRLAFFRGYSAQQRNGSDGKPRGKAKYSTTVLLDPSNAAHAEMIKKTKAEGYRALIHMWGSKENFPKPNPATGMGGLIYCYGYGNDLPKIYDGFKDMFYVKLSDTERPLIGNRAGRNVAEGEPEAPYSGCIAIAKATFYPYDNESRGVNANFRSVQYVAPGAAFGGRGQLDPSQEFTPLGAADAPAATSTGTEKDPWD